MNPPTPDTGLDAGPDTGLDRLAHTVAAVQQHASYLRCATEAPEADGWAVCADLIADPHRLRAEIDATRPGRGTDDAQVAASLYVQSYSYRVPSIAVAAYALGLPGPSVEPGSTAVRVTRHRPGEVAHLDPTCRVVDAHMLAADLFDGHLVAFVDAVRAATLVGERLLWGNVAASLAAVFRGVQSAGPLGDPDVRARAEAFERAAAPWIGGLGGWSTVEVPGARGWYWTRTSCCLWYRTSGGSYCADCSLHDPDELAARRLAELTQPDGTSA